MNKAKIDAVLVKLDSIQIDPKAHASINYAKARCAIEEVFPVRAEKRLAKMTIIEHLHGQVMHPPKQTHQKSPLPNYVQFPDNTKARF